MPTPTSTISLTNVKNTINEGISTNYGTGAAITFNDTLVRALAGKTTAGSAISMNDMRGKAGPAPLNTVVSSYCSGTTLIVVTADGRYGTTTTNTPNSNSCRATIVGGSATISSNQADYTINVATLAGYVAGRSDITITVNPGVYVYATATTNAGLTITGATAGDTIRLINYGYIMGKGGDGGGYLGAQIYPLVGGPAISLGWHATIDNTYASAYIGGGGGGGGGSGMSAGGGGAGGGTGGKINLSTGLAGTGGTPGMTGGTGGQGGLGTAATGGGSGGGGGGVAIYYGGGSNQQSPRPEAGGGGGRIFPGVGGTGGTGLGTGGNGGSANNVGGTGAGGGGGGWGASGGFGTNGSFAGATGGKAVQLNGNGVTWVSGDTTRVYGAVI